MTDAKQPSVTRHLSEIEAHQLLARAAELDARFASSVSRDQLLSAAREAGISELALAQAQRELDDGSLLSPTRGAAIRAGLRTFSLVAASAVGVLALMASPNYPLAQLAGLGFAVYGAYDILRRVGRRLGKRRNQRGTVEAESPAVRAEQPIREDVSMATRVFAFSAPLGAA